jgi:hypothetical protein
MQASAVADECNEVRRGTIDGPDRRVQARQSRKYNRTPNVSERAQNRPQGAALPNQPNPERK